jgi:hypothetical protein
LHSSNKNMVHRWTIPTISRGLRPPRVISSTSSTMSFFRLWKYLELLMSREIESTRETRNSHTQPRRGRKTETKVGICLRNQ